MYANESKNLICLLVRDILNYFMKRAIKSSRCAASFRGNKRLVSAFM